MSFLVNKNMESPYEPGFVQTDHIVSETAPLIVRVEDTAEYANIRRAVADEMRREAMRLLDNETLSIAVLGIGSEQSIHDLLSGTANLINYVIDQQRQGLPFDTMFFLDKSARNGAYLFRTLWTELEKRNEIPEGVQMPHLRFIDIGHRDRKKYTSEFALTLLKQKFMPEDVENKRVLIVDEYSNSKNTLKQSLKTIGSEFRTQVTGITQFRSLPFWYSNSFGESGVEDAIPNYEFSRVVQMMRTIDADKQSLFLDLFHKCSKTDFCEVLSYMAECSKKGMDVSSVLSEYSSLPHSSSITNEELRVLFELVSSNGIAKTDSEEVWKYITSAGGFLTRPLSRSEDQKDFNIYRNVLQKIVQSYMEKRDTMKAKESARKQVFYGTSTDT
jgi:hypoxanthine phosphoribosyltransferase